MSELQGAELQSFFDVLCDAAAKETLPRFRLNGHVDNKLDTGFDPVTEADKEAESIIRSLISEHFPDHGIIGEEHGVINQGSPWQWIIDPIDGTRAFISGLPMWGTLIGLYYHTQPYAGVMDQPFTRERFFSVPNNGTNTAWLAKDGAEVALKSSGVRELGQATLMTTDPNILSAPEDARYHDLSKLVKMRRYGADCYAYCMLAMGNVDLVVESGLNVYDIAPLISIIRAAGGIVTNWEGGDCSQGGQILAAANADLHEQAIAILKN